VNDRFETIKLTNEKITELERLLHDFCVQARTVWALLVSSSGHLLAQRGFVYSFDVLTIAALTSSIFNSTMELARIVGEEKFREFLQEGKKASIYYITVDTNYMLVSLFDDRTIAGVVKVASEEFSSAIQGIVREVA
jgi:predicted regulator of Ras-like GTPase activity (Roadblock/LC7/MglB family)